MRHCDAIEMVFAHIFPLIWAFQWLAHLLPIKLQINLALNYGSKDEIIDAIKLSLKTKKKITKKNIENNLYTKNIPNPDILIRTGNTNRLSNFLLWQLAYSEFYFTDVLWPDFGSEEIEKALTSFSTRIRRFGRTDDQISKMKERPCSQKD